MAGSPLEFLSRSTCEVRTRKVLKLKGEGVAMDNVRLVPVEGRRKDLGRPRWW